MTLFNTLFGETGNTPCGRYRRRAAPLGLETLHDRTVPSCTIGLTGDGELQIHGTGVSDTVHVYRDGGHVIVRCQSAGDPAPMLHSFSYGEVNRVWFRGESGDDIFVNDTELVSRAAGNAGIDLLVGGSGRDELVGGTGDDTIKGNSGDDTINGREGNDTIDGGDGADVIYGMEGNDTISGGTGNDRIEAGVGDDVVYGGDGNDSLFGQWGKDTLRGEEGNDDLNGGYDGFADALYGGGGCNDFADHVYLVSGVWVSEDVFVDIGGCDTTNRHEHFGPP